jgi:hypothetical protein
MQFGRCLPRLLQQIVHSDPCHGPVKMTKEDIADGFYRLHNRPSDILALGVVFISTTNGTLLVAFPLTCPMGWVESSPWFTTATKTGANLANAVLAADFMPSLHQLDSVTQTLPPPPAPMAPLLGDGPFPNLPAPVPPPPPPPPPSPPTLRPPPPTPL